MPVMYNAQVFPCFFTSNKELGLALIQTALALSGQVQTTDTINTLSASVTTVIDKQASANVKIQGGLMLVNQRIDLVQKQLDVLWQIAQLGCKQKFPRLCVTSIQHQSEWLKSNIQVTADAGKDVEKEEHSSIAGGIASWYNHSGNQISGSSGK